MTDQPPERSFFIGRWQPLHQGHVAIIRQALDAGRNVLVGIMDTPISERNPFSVSEREHMFWTEFGPEMQVDTLTLLTMPWIDEVCYGRNCGWQSRRIKLSPRMEQITATSIRAQTACV